jgi:hypothetical protein
VVKRERGKLEAMRDLDHRSSTHPATVKPETGEASPNSDQRRVLTLTRLLSIAQEQEAISGYDSLEVSMSMLTDRSNIVL